MSGQATKNDGIEVIQFGKGVSLQKGETPFPYVIREFKSFSGSPVRFRHQSPLFGI